MDIVFAEFSLLASFASAAVTGGVSGSYRRRSVDIPSGFFVVDNKPKTRSKKSYD
jgi:hypothetical protein